MELIAAHIGIDIGQQHDPTAICAATVHRRDTGRYAWHDAEYHQLFGRCNESCVREGETVYCARFFQRLPLGTPYPDVADRLVQVVTNLRALIPDVVLHVYLDATGVGRPVADLILHRVRDRCRFTIVTFTAGHRCERDSENPAELRLGKAFLVSRLQALFQSGRIQAPTPASAPALANDLEALQRELQTYEIRIDASAHDTYGAFRVGTHDDLVTALGLAVVEEVRSNSAVGAFRNW